MKYKCWKCGQENEEQQSGYCQCSKCNNWYSPVEEKKPTQEFLDYEERGE